MRHHLLGTSPIALTGNSGNSPCSAGISVVFVVAAVSCCFAVAAAPALLSVLSKAKAMLQKNTKYTVFQQL